MSASFLNKRHIDGLVTWAVYNKLVDRSEATDVGRMLWAENLRSLKARYRGTLSTYTRQVDGYSWHEEQEMANIPHSHIVRMAQCYDYQCSETDDYDCTEAFDLMVGIRAAVADKMADGCLVWEYPF